MSLTPSRKLQLLLLSFRGKNSRNQSRYSPPSLILAINDRHRSSRYRRNPRAEALSAGRSFRKNKNLDGRSVNGTIAFVVGANRMRLAFSICILTGFRKVMNILRPSGASRPINPVDDNANDVRPLIRLLITLSHRSTRVKRIDQTKEEDRRGLARNEASSVEEFGGERYTNRWIRFRNQLHGNCDTTYDKVEF